MSVRWGASGWQYQYCKDVGDAIKGEANLFATEKPAKRPNTGPYAISPVMTSNRLKTFQPPKSERLQDQCLNWIPITNR